MSATGTCTPIENGRAGVCPEVIDKVVRAARQLVEKEHQGVDDQHDHEEGEGNRHPDNVERNASELVHERTGRGVPNRLGRACRAGGVGGRGKGGQVHKKQKDAEQGGRNNGRQGADTVSALERKVLGACR